ncbi:MAG: DNA polymerase IV [Thermoplasmata archaeon]
MRWVVYADMDAFYVSCELRTRPEDRGRPVIVGPSPKIERTRGVVLSASYEARQFGVHSAQPVGEADRLCPEAVWIPPDHAKYERASAEVRAWLAARFGEVRPQSIDEFAIAVEAESVDAVRPVAEQVQQGLREDVGLPCSIGVAARRVLAKIASDRAKPGGIVVVPADPASVRDFLAPLPVRAIPGVGPKTEELLRASGVSTIGELASHRPSELAGRLGPFAHELIAIARGEGTDPVDEETGPRSRSTDRTFPQDVDRWEDVEPAVRELARDLAGTLEKEGLRYATVGVAFRWSDFARSQRSRSLGAAHEGPDSIEAAATRLARELWEAERTGRGRSIRTVSVRTERLSERRQKQVSLDEFGRSPPSTGSLRENPRTPQ